RCQGRIQGELRGDGAAIRQNSTVVSKSVAKCRKVSRSAGWAEDLSGASGVLAIAFQFNGIANLCRRGAGGADRPLGATNRVSCRNVGCESAAAGGGERRNLMKSDELD